MYPDLFKIPFTELNVKSYGFFWLLGSLCLVYSIIKYHKLPIRQFLDILAISLFIFLTFRGIGCFLNGCCFGKPSEVLWAVRFPYYSFVYHSQVEVDTARGRTEPYLKLPNDFFYYEDKVDKLTRILKPYNELTDLQKNMVNNGQYMALPVHPTQLYSSMIAAVNCFILFVLLKSTRKLKSFLKPGSIFGMMFILYGTTRFFVEFLRDDNPFVFDGVTMSQIISITMIGLGMILVMAFSGVCRRHELKDRYKRKAIKHSSIVKNNFDEVLVELEKLGELKEKGVLTDEEFRAQKEKLLSS
jgi:phosphatidylglycerol:prolipoprotein diacylglycerol transferase